MRAMFLLVLCCGCLDARKVGTTAQPAGTVTPRPGPVVQVQNANSIQVDFLNNPIAAEQKWIGKRVRLRSMVTEIDKDARGFYVTLNAGISVYPSTDQLAAFGAVKRMDAIEVESAMRY